jgi:hypothetical protein
VNVLNGQLARLRFTSLTLAAGLASLESIRESAGGGGAHPLEKSALDFEVQATYACNLMGESSRSKAHELGKRCP